MLEVGETFAGCKVERAESAEVGRVWVFSRGGQCILIHVPWADYFDACVSPIERERFLDHLAEGIYESFKQKEQKINSLQANN